MDEGIGVVLGLNPMVHPLKLLLSSIGLTSIDRLEHFPKRPLTQLFDQLVRFDT